jgi:hypothetical protein
MRGMSLCMASRKLPGCTDSTAIWLCYI